MSKFQSVLRLLAQGKLTALRQRARINLRQRRLRQARGKPFVYQLGGFPFVCIPGAPDSEETFLTGEFDDFELTLLRAWLQPGDAFVDIGANFGIYSFAVSHFLRDEGAILAIEASPELQVALATSSQLLGRRSVTFEHRAAGDSEREVTFYLAPPGKSRGEQSLHPDPDRAADYVPHRVQMSTLAEIVSRHPRVAQPAAIKLDIEGAEPGALHGVPRSWLSSSGPLAIVEVNPSALARSGSSCPALVAHFPPESFDRWLQPQYARSGARHLPLRRLQHGEAFADAWFYNLIAVPRAAALSARRQRLDPILQRAARP